MVLSNLKYPVWYPVPCDRKIGADIICTTGNWANIHKKLLSTFLLHNHLVLNIICPESHILFHNKCYFLSRFTGQRNFLTKKCIRIDKRFLVILKYGSKVNEERETFCCSHDDCFQYNKLTEQMEPAKKEKNLEREIIYVETKSANALNFSANMFSLQIVKCKSGEFYSIFALFYSNMIICGSKVIDNLTVHDCGHTHKSSQTKCTHSCETQKCQCGELFYQKQNGACSPYIHPCSNHRKDCGIILPNKTPPDANHFFAKDNFIVSRSQETIDLPKHNSDNISNFYTDCTSRELLKSREDSLLANRQCHDSTYIKCTIGCERCFNIHKLCVFELDQHGSVMHCPSGAYLQNCIEMECNNMFKCLRHYCVPYRYFFVYL